MNDQEIKDCRYCQKEISKFKSWETKRKENLVCNHRYVIPCNICGWKGHVDNEPEHRKRCHGIMSIGDIRHNVFYIYSSCNKCKKRITKNSYGDEEPHNCQEETPYPRIPNSRNQNIPSQSSNDNSNNFNYSPSITSLEWSWLSSLITGLAGIFFIALPFILLFLIIRFLWNAGSKKNQ